MKKKNLKSLKLNKKSISNLHSMKGAAPAQTCEGPCQNGTGCCHAPCVTHNGGNSCQWFCMDKMTPYISTPVHEAN